MYCKKAGGLPLRPLPLTNQPAKGENTFSPLTGQFLKQMGQEISTVKMNSYFGLS